MSIIAVIVTHLRAEPLRRLLAGLAESSLPLRAVVISDHAPGGETMDLAEACPLEVRVLQDPSNPGPGAGWANAARAGLKEFPEAEAVWFLDDDVVVAPDTLATLVNEINRVQAEAIAPLLEDASGKLWAFPEPESPGLRPLIRECETPATARLRLGDEPLAFCWCTGACFLVKRSAIEKAGWHRTDFWMLGEDLEYSMRIAAGARAVFTCKVTVPHLPPAATSPDAARQSDYRKFCALLQNLTYLAFHSPHSRHMKLYLPGNYRRFFRTHGLGPRTVAAAWRCFWQAAVCSRPAGFQRQPALPHGD